MLDQELRRQTTLNRRLPRRRRGGMVMAETERGWMPVFALVERRQNLQAAHPDHKGDLPVDAPVDVVQRIGTAWLEPDGAFLISLTSIPLNGQLLMRPPRGDESPDSTVQEAR
jgi:hypothetical protein